jgi:K+-sensing histidine kinase KdpD
VATTPPELTRPAGLPPRRRLGGLLLAGAALPATTAVLTAVRGTLSLASVLLLYLLAVVSVAVVGGILPAVLAAVGSFLLANWYLTPPYHTFRIEQRDAVIALTVYLLVASTVSVAVELAARRRAAAVRNQQESELLSRLASAPVSGTGLAGILDNIRQNFGMRSVALLERQDGGERELAAVGPPRSGTPTISVPAGDGLRVVGEGPPTFAEDRRLLRSLATAAARAVEGQRLAVEAGRAAELAETDRLRAALLASVGHDLRTPLATVKAAVSSLRQHDVAWSPADTAELLAAIEDSADRLDALVGNLLDMSRLQAGVLSVELGPVALDEVAARALIDLRGAGVRVDVPDDLPLVRADAGLLERALANLLTNAHQHGPDLVEVVAEVTPDEVRLAVRDHGPGVAPHDRDRMFAPFQRLSDRRAGGIGLGLAIARGFVEAMGGTLRPSTTPGGGLTMTVTLPIAR